MGIELELHSEQPACHNGRKSRATGEGHAGNVKYVTLAPGGPFISHPNVIVMAVDSGAKDTVYPVGGGTSWKAPGRRAGGGRGSRARRAHG